MRIRHDISKFIQPVFRKTGRRVQISIYGSLGALVIFTALFFSGNLAQLRSTSPTPAPTQPSAQAPLILNPHPTQEPSIEQPIISHQPSPTPVPTQKPTAPPVKKQPTAPPAAPTQPPAAPSGSVQEMIYQAFGPTYGPGALNVAKCESGLNPNAYNATSIGGSHAAGIFQILYPSTWAGTSQGKAGLSPYNAQANIQAAHEIFVRDGYSWREWVCQP